MARVKDPVLFSKKFGINPELFAVAGLIDPFLNVDTQLFVDPILLEKSSNRMISKDASQNLRKNFENFLRLIAISEKKRDAAWRATERLLDLSEPPENGLGYGNSGRSGSSRPEKVRAAIMTTAKEIMRTGANDPEMISLMGFFEEDVGPDTISDYTTRVISEQLGSITQAFCKKVGVECFENDLVENSLLPKFVDDKGREKFVVLIPRDIVRELPVAADWNGIEEAIAHSERIRTAVNSYLAGIARPTVAERKDALKSIALQSKESFNELLSAVKEHTTTYDPNLDALGYYRIKDIFASGYEGVKTERSYKLLSGSAEVKRLVDDTIALFKRHIEDGNLWEELWIGNVPKKERAAQLIYYAISDAFCKANDVDISPEANMGGDL